MYLIIIIIIIMIIIIITLLLSKVIFVVVFESNYIIFMKKNIFKLKYKRLKNKTIKLYVQPLILSVTKKKVSNPCLKKI